MRKFIKVLPKRHPLSTEIRDLHGAEAYTYLCDLLDLAQEIGFFELTPKIAARECGINVQKASRIFENLKRIFEESCHFLQLSSNKVEESSKKVETLDGQNPHSSTRDQEENREEEKKEKETLRVSKKAAQENEKKIHFPKSPAGELVSHLHEKLVTKGLTPTFLNQNWSDIGVREANSLLATETAEEIRKAIDWFASDTRFWADHLNRMSHVRRNWDHYLRDKPTGTTTKKAVDASAASKLMEFPFVIHVLTNEIMPTADLELREGDAGVLWHGVNTYYPIAHLRGVEGYEPDKATGELSSNGRHPDTAALA